MKTITRSLLLGGVLLAPPAGLRAPAADPQPAAKPVRGTVLVVDEDRLLEGDIEKIGDQYRIKRTVGETWVPGSGALALCADREGAYEYLRGKANLRDPDERLRLARWCHLRGLREQAIIEATAAVELRPQHAPTREYLAALQRAAAAAQSAPPAEPVKPVELTALPVPEVNPEAFKLFVTKVQPILMNTCASCHCGDHGGHFRLMRAYEGGLNNSKPTQYNLAAVAAQLNREHPAGSPLLTKAINAHGEATAAPIVGSQLPFKTLERWVQMVAPEAGAAPAPAALPTSIAAAPPLTPESGRFAEAPKPAPVTPVTLTTPPVAVPTQPAAVPPAGAQSLPVAVPDAPADPFDPQIFNQKAHPGKSPAK
jgi:hypothetical protein